jgi:hypothetical protein
MSVSRTRNNNYIQEMGLREFTAATSGNYEVDFSFDGIFAPKLCENWLGYAFMMGDGNEVDDIVWDSDTVITCYSDPAFQKVVSDVDDDAVVYVKLTNGSSTKYTWTSKTPTSVTEPPTPATAGVAGNLAKDTTTNKVYVCIGAETGYNWVVKVPATATQAPDEDTPGAIGDLIKVSNTYYVCKGNTGVYNWETVVPTSGSVPTSSTTGTIFSVINASSTYYVLVDVPENKWVLANVIKNSPVPTTTTEGKLYDVRLNGTSAYYVCTAVPSGVYKFGQPMLGADVKKYTAFVKHQAPYDELTGTSVVKLFGYKNLTGPKYFDIGYQKINSHASGVGKYDGLDEIGVLVGCVIDSASISYESGSDAGVKFSISGHALRDIVEMVQGSTLDYASYLDPVPTEVFVGGCVSVYNEGEDDYLAVAQTDSASISIANNTTKLGNCLKLNYSSYAMGALTYDVSTSTYSNDPNKYLKYLYGYTDDFEDGETYFIAKQPIPLEHMKIRTDDTSARRKVASMFMDINMTKVYVGDMSNSYSVDSAIMDEPSLRPQKVYIAVGYTEPSS